MQEKKTNLPFYKWGEKGRFGLKSNRSHFQNIFKELKLIQRFH